MLHLLLLSLTFRAYDREITKTAVFIVINFSLILNVGDAMSGLIDNHGDDVVQIKKLPAIN